MFWREAAPRLRLTAALAIGAALWHHTAIAQTPPATTLTIAGELDRSDELRATAEGAIAHYSEWLGPARLDRIDIVERASSPSVNPRALTITIGRPFLPPALLMEVESAVAYGIAAAGSPVFVGVRTWFR